MKEYLQSKGSLWRAEPSHIVIRTSAAAFFAMAEVLPLTLASNVAGLFGRTIGRRFMKRSNFSRNLSTAFPEKSPDEIAKLILSIYDNIGRVAAESAHLGDFAKGLAHTSIVVEGREHLPKFGPAVFVGCHLSNWDIGVVAIARELGGLNTLFTPTGIPALDARLERNRRASGAKYLPRNRTTLKAILDGIEGGVGVAMLVDQRVDSGPEVKFFGRDARASDFPAKLAVRFNIPIVPVDGDRLAPNHFVVRLHPQITADAYQGADQIRAMTQDVMVALEKFIRRSPGTWFCHKLRWKTPGSTSHYRHDRAADAVACEIVPAELSQ